MTRYAAGWQIAVIDTLHLFMSRCMDFVNTIFRYIRSITQCSVDSVTETTVKIC